MHRYFGQFGGQFAAETLLPALEELERSFVSIKDDKSFWQEYRAMCRDFIGRETPITALDRISAHLGGARILAKREDLCHTGAHKINNAIGQALMARRLGKSRVIAETGAGQHGVATAAACAALGLDCVVYMGAKDAKRQAPNAQRMKLFGAELRLVRGGSATLKDAVNEAMRDWITTVNHSHYIIGSVIGPFPFPDIVRTFQEIIGQEARRQMLEQFAKLPDWVVACVGGGSNAIGMFSGFLSDPAVKLVGVQAGGNGSQNGHHSTPLLRGSPGVLHGTRTLLLQDSDGQILSTHSIAPGLDYPGVGPEHAFLKETGRAEYREASDAEAMAALQLTCRLEGILPALESSHALAAAFSIAKQRTSTEWILVNLSGRGDKDLAIVAENVGLN
jgi:tryptophan synthase beta chain